MPYLVLDFTRPAPRYNVIVTGFILFIVLCTTVIFVLQQQQMYSEIKLKQNITINDGSVRPRLKADPDLELQLSAAYKTQKALNLNWQEIFKALELSKQGNPLVKLLSIQPKPESGVILLAGEAPEFDMLVKYVNDLRQQPGLGEAVLLNQHWEKNLSTEDGVYQDKLLFNLSVKWLL